MPEFVCRVANDRGQVHSQVERAASESELRTRFAEQGFHVYSIWQRRGEQTALQLSVILSHMPIEIVAADLELARLAAQLKARHGLPYADGFAAGLAILRNADVATTDRHFQRVAHLVPVRMLS